MATARRQGDSPPRARDGGGLSMVVIAISLLITVALALLAAEMTFGSSGPESGSTAGNPEVAMADHLQAQQSLSTALTAVATQAAAGGGGGAADGAGDGAGDGLGGVASGVGDGLGDGGGTGSGGVDITQLQAADPSLTFVSGPTSGPTTVSVASDTSTPGAVTLATRSSDSVCWLVWRADGSSTWYGAQTGLASCTAPAMGSPPSPGPVGSTSIGWQTGGFPSA